MTNALQAASRIAGCDDYDDVPRYLFTTPEVREFVIASHHAHEALGKACDGTFYRRAQLLADVKANNPPEVVNSIIKLNAHYKSHTVDSRPVVKAGFKNVGMEEVVYEAELDHTEAVEQQVEAELEEGEVVVDQVVEEEVTEGMIQVSTAQTQGESVCELVARGKVILNRRVPYTFSEVRDMFTWRSRGRAMVTIRRDAVLFVYGKTDKPATQKELNKRRGALSKAIGTLIKKGNPIVTRVGVGVQFH